MCECIERISDGVIEVHMKVLSGAIGAIIGRSGCYIQEVRERTGAKIKIEDESAIMHTKDGSDIETRMVKIHGFIYAVEQAIDLIRLKLSGRRFLDAAPATGASALSSSSSTARYY